jgi:hypothetical protein
MMDVESNYYGDKVNYFVERHFTVALTRDRGTLHHQVTIDLINHQACGSYVRTSYKVDVRLYVGNDASSLTHNLRPVKYANPAPPTGMRLMDGWLPDVLCNGGRGHAVFNYDTQFQTGAITHTIYWQKQPGTSNDSVDVIWNNGSGHTSRATGNLGQDRKFTLSVTGITLTAGHPAQATLPSLSLG